MIRPPDPLLRATFHGATVLTAALLFGATPVSAQTILNTERFQLADVSGFHLGADVNFQLQRGNKELLDVGTSGMVGYLQGRHWTRVIFGGKYLSDADRSILDQQFVQLRYSYIFSPSLRSFHFVQAQKNETLRLKSRWLLGSGIRRTFLQTEHATVALGTGIMAEWERLNPEDLPSGEPLALDALRMANLGVFSWEFAGGARLLNIFYLQPDLTEPSDLRMLNDLGLLVPITDRVRATMSLEWRRDTRPPATLRRDDMTMKMGIGIDVR